MDTELTLSARGSGSSNTTKTNSTDNSSRHSNASTTASSADLNGHEDWKLSANKKSVTEYTQSSRPTSFLKSGGRSWSFGGSKKQLPPTPLGQENVPATPELPEQYQTGRARATTSSTDATVTPPQLEQDFRLDLGGSFSKMLLGFDKRSSAMALRDESERQVLQPSAMTGGRVNAPSPIQIDRVSHVEPPQHSWASHRSDDNLLANENAPPPVPKHGDPLPRRAQGPNTSASDSILKRTSAIFGGRRKSINALDANNGDDLDTSLLAVNRFMSSDPNSRSTTPLEAIGRQRNNDESSGSGYTVVPPKSPASKLDFAEDDNMFDNIPLTTSRLTTPRQPPAKKIEAQAQNKVMTPLEFEKYRKDKEVETRRAEVDRAREQVVDHEDDEEEDIYEDDEDEMEKSKQVAKQRRKQEAHMTVYRQQMMKVTGESADAFPMRPGMNASFSSPHLTVPESSRNPSSDNSEDDEEVPLAILAAHGFPNKHRPPTRLNNMMSNPNLRQAAQPSYQRPGSAQGPVPTGNGPLPPFARGLPQDPYGLVNTSVRESFALGGGVPAGQNPPAPPGGLVGVIANEERARSLRRGSPQVSQMDSFQGSPAMGPGGFDPMQGIPQQMMYPQAMQMQQMQNMMLSPGDQAQIQLSQQMSQFMQMQMQFMQMMSGQNSQGLEPPRSAGHMNSQSLNQIPNMTGMNGMGVGMDMNNGASGSFLELPTMDSARGDMAGRTMSMVQPSSSSWLQPPAAHNAGYAGSIRGQGYAPSVAPSERSNVGLPGRYRPVSNMPPSSTTPDHGRTKSFMSGAMSPLGDNNKTPKADASRKSPTKEDADDDDEEGWAAMKAKRDKKKSSWRVKKNVAPSDLDIGSLIT